MSACTLRSSLQHDLELYWKDVSHCLHAQLSMLWMFSGLIK